MNEAVVNAKTKTFISCSWTIVGQSLVLVIDREGPWNGRTCG